MKGVAPQKARTQDIAPTVLTAFGLGTDGYDGVALQKMDETFTRTQTFLVVQGIPKPLPFFLFRYALREGEWQFAGKIPIKR